VFAAIAGRLTAAAAQWRLERGTSINCAELLNGSRTLGGTILTICQLRHVNRLSLFLFLLWATSPFGSQSLLRILSTRLEDVKQPATIIYESSRGSLGLEDTFPGKMLDPMMSFSAKTAFSTLLLSPKRDKLSPMDTWGNIKIPILRPENNTQLGMGESWRRVSNSEMEIQYSSLLGIPMEVPSTPGNISFPIESSYIHLDCANITVLKPLDPLQAFQPVLEKFPLGMNLSKGTWLGRNTSAADGEYFPDAALWAVALDRFATKSLYSYSPDDFKNKSGQNSGPTKLFFQIPSRVTAPISFPNSFETTCKVLQKYVESEVSCEVPPASPRKCSVVAQRPSRQKHAAEDISQLSFPVNFNILSSELPRIVSRLSFKSPGDISLQYLVNPFIEELMGMKDLDFWAMDRRIFSTRFMQILNTYTMAYKFLVSATTGKVSKQAVEVDTERSELVERVIISRLWISIAMATCAIMLVTAITGSLLIHRSVGPEVLGYVSTAIRDSRFIHLAEEDRWLGGFDLTLRMSNSMIRLGMVRMSPGQAPVLGLGKVEDVKALDTKREDKKIRHWTRFGEREKGVIVD
jgi:hypothetical protein